MNGDQLKGLPVVGLVDGEPLGTVERAYFDPSTKRIVGFAFTASGGFLRPESSPMIDADEVSALDPEALVLAEPSAAHGRETAARYVELIDLDELMHRPVVTDGGRRLGQVTSVEFDESTLQLTTLEVGSGAFRHPTSVAVDDILTIGEVIVVGDAVEGGNAATPAGIEAEREAFQPETHEIVLRREELTVEKRVRVAEEIVLTKERFRRDETASGTVRRERVHVAEHHAGAEPAAEGTAGAGAPGSAST